MRTHAIHSFFAIHFLLAAGFLATPSARATETLKLAPVVQPYVDNKIVAGAVLAVAGKDKTLGVETVGWSNIADTKPMRPDTMFWIASMTKPITCTALMMLVDEGKIDVDSPVSKYLPEFKDQMVIAEKSDDRIVLKRPNRPMLVRDVMNHTSGLAKGESVPGLLKDEDLSLAVKVAAYSTRSLESEPGTTYVYSNPGMNTVGRLVEKVSGMPYETFLQTRLFDPLGMKDTTFWPSDEQVARLATCYRASKDKSDLTPAAETDPFRRRPLSDRKRSAFPAGGLFSTADDLVKFCRMILNNGTLDGRRYLSPERLKQMTTRQTGEGIPESYGFGWSTGGGLIAHGGAWKTNMTIDPKSGLITVFLIQIGDWRDEVEGRKVEPAFRNAAVEKFVGTLPPSGAATKTEGSTLQQ